MGFLPDLTIPPEGLPNIRPPYSYLPNLLPQSGGLPNLAPQGGFLPNIGPASFNLPSFGGFAGGSFLPNLNLPSFNLPNLQTPGYSLWDAGQHPTPAPAPNATAPVAGGTTLPTPAGATHAAPYMAEINQVSQESGVPADVLAAIIDTENSGPNSVSPANARGIMQVVDGPMDVLGSIRAGAQVLKDKMAINHYAPDDWNSTAGAYLGFGTDVGGMTTSEYMRRFANNRAAYATPTLRQTLATPTSTTPGGYIFPVDGFQGPVQLHWGAVAGGSDLMAPRGTPIRAMRGGMVLESGWNNVGGNSVLIRGDDGNSYYYAHMDTPPSVAVGQQVTPGTYLGPVGNTGDAQGGPTHLHIGIGPEIRLGADKYGGTGGDYPATQLLQGVLDGTR